jgi:hypothetical protein
MLNNTLLPIFPEIFGKSILAMAEEVTGISEKTWRAGGPKRPNKLKNANAYSKNYLINTLQQRGEFSLNEALERTKYIMSKNAQTSGIMTSLVQSFNFLGTYEWLQTEILAKELDKIGAELLDLRKNNDISLYKQRLISLCDEANTKAWLDSIPEFTGLVEKTATAEDWIALAEITAYWIVQGLFRILACWDVEFQSKFLINKVTHKGMKPQPIFLMVMPMMNPNAKKNLDGSFSARGIFRLPLRRLLDFSFCLAYCHRRGNWPKKTVISRPQISAWIIDSDDESSAQNSENLLAKIYRGTKGISASEFSDMWVSMCGKDKEGFSPMPPWPIYIAAQIWTLLFVKKTQINGSKTASALVSIDPAIYKYWWDIYYKEFTDNGVPFGDIPWPEHLAAP